MMGNMPFYNYLSQFIPVARCFPNSEVSCIAVNRIVLQAMRHLPYFKDIICVKVHSSPDSNYNLVATSMSIDEGLEKYGVAYPYFMNQFVDPGLIARIDIDQSLMDVFDSYDRILIIYDGLHPVYYSFFQKVLKELGDKCFGRINMMWSKDMTPLRDDVFMPQEVVEALGFPWDVSLLRVDREYFKEFLVDKPYDRNKISMSFLSGCDSYEPADPSKHYMKSARLKTQLRTRGFRVESTDLSTDIVHQIPPHYSSGYMITVDSSFAWGHHCFFPQLEGYLIHKPDPKLEKRLGLPNLVGPEFSNLADVPPEYIAEAFAKRVGKSIKL
jgi:hypothetical protein